MMVIQTMQKYQIQKEKKKQFVHIWFLCRCHLFTLGVLYRCTLCLFFVHPTTHWQRLYVHVLLVVFILFIHSFTYLFKFFLFASLTIFKWKSLRILLLFWLLLTCDWYAFIWKALCLSRCNVWWCYIVLSSLLLHTN